MDNETITISKKQYDRLKKDSTWLGCLEAAGVDNWEGISEARRLRDGDAEDDEEDDDDDDE